MQISGVKVSGRLKNEALDPTGSSLPELIPGFCSMKVLGVFLTPPGQDASPSQVIPLQFVRFPNNLPVPIYTPGWREAL